MLVGQQHELLVSGPAVNPEIYRATFLSTGAAMALVVWDTLLTLDDEVDYIWSGSGRTCVKWIYLFSRWFGFMNQIGVQICQCFVAACAPVPVSTCEAFFIVEAIAFQSLQLCFDAVLILRILAVYRRHLLCTSIALAIVLFETLLSITTQAISVPKSTVDGACIIHHTPVTTTCLGIGIIVSQSILFFLIYRGRSLLQPAARQSKLVTVVIRDGVLSFGVVVGIVVIFVIYFLFDEVVINAFLPWMTVVPSILTPRMILNMQMAAEPTESLLEFTTNLDITPNSDIHDGSSVHEMSIIYEQSRDTL